MAHVIAYGPEGKTNIPCHDNESAKRLASELMRNSETFGRADIFDDNGRFITTAWGE